MSAASSPSPRAVLAGAAALTAALSLATPEIMRWEGKRNDPYRDLVGVMTVCHGETQAPMRHYSDAECAALLERRLERDYARPVLACAPALAGRTHAFAASISLAYNIGRRAFAGRRSRAGSTPATGAAGARRCCSGTAPAAGGCPASPGAARPNGRCACATPPDAGQLAYFPQGRPRDFTYL